MAEQGGQERTEKATSKKRRDSRLQGVVARSTEINSLVILFVGTMFFYFGGHYVSRNISNMFHEILGAMPTFHPTAQNVYSIFGVVVLFMAKTLGPLVALVFLAGLLVNAAQVGVVLTADPLTPKMDRINPISGFGRLFSMKAVMEIVKAVLKMAIVGWVGYVTIKGAYTEFIPLSDAGVPVTADFIARTIYLLLFRCLAAMTAIAILDYGYERWSYEKQLRMTKQEVKEEMRQSDGDPMIKARIRSAQMKMARENMMRKVPKADVVVTNPTHFAVALQYDPETMAAPRVLAKGTMLIAEKIKEVARENGVPIVENKPLAQALYKSVDIDEEIPAALYKAVAEVLAYVFQLKNKRAANVPNAAGRREYAGA